jgi:hypothetical protein
LGLFVILGAVVQDRGVDVVSVEVFTNWEVLMRGEKVVAATRTNEHQGAGLIVGNQREVEGGMGVWVSRIPERGRVRPKRNGRGRRHAFKLDGNKPGG